MIQKITKKQIKNFGGNMECENCEYKVFDHYFAGVKGAPIYSCGHPKALEIWAEYDGELCPVKVKNYIEAIQKKLEKHRKAEFITCPENCLCWDIEVLLDIVVDLIEQKAKK